MKLNIIVILVTGLLSANTFADTMIGSQPTVSAATIKFNTLELQRETL